MNDESKKSFPHDKKYELIDCATKKGYNSLVEKIQESFI